MYFDNILIIKINYGIWVEIIERIFVLNKMINRSIYSNRFTYLDCLFFGYYFEY